MSDLVGGSVVWNLDVDTSKLSKGLNEVTKKIESTAKDVSKTLDSMSKNFTNAGKKLSLAITTPIVAVGTASFKMAADLQDAIGATNQIFKGQAKSMQTWAKGIESYYGIAEGEALTYANKMGAMLQNIGQLNEVEANKQAQTLIKLAGDLTAMFGGTTQDAIMALTGSLKGNNTMLDNYGMAVNDALIKTKAMEMGLMQEGKEMSLATKQAATLALITEQTADVTGQAAREATGASGSLRALQTEIKNLSTSIGTTLLPIITPMVQKMTKLVKAFANLSPEQQKNIIMWTGLAAAIGPLLIALGAVLNAINQIGTAFGGLIKSLGFVGSLKSVVAIFNGIGIGAKAIGVAVAGISTSVLITIGVITALIAIGVLLYKNWDKIKETAINFGKSISDTFKNVKESISNNFGNIKNTIIKTWNDVGNSISSFVDKNTNNLSKLWGSIKSNIDTAWNGIKNFFTVSIPNAFNTALNFMKELPGKISSFFVSLPDIIGNFFWQGVLNIAYSIGYIYGYLSVKVPELIDNISNWFSALPGKIWGFLTETYNNFVKWGTDTWNYLSTSISNWLIGIGKFFYELPGIVWNWLTTTYNNFVAWGESTWKYLSEQIGMWLFGIGMFFSALPGIIWKWLTSTYDSIKKWGVNTWTFLSTEIPRWITGILKWFSELPGKIAAGLSNLANTIRTVFSNAWNTLVDEIKQWPSRIWDWGRNIASSFVDGFKNSLKGIADAFTRGINDAKRNMEGHSPPKEGPLKEIDKWGFNIGQAWTSGFASSISGLKNLIGSINFKDMLSLDSYGMSMPDYNYANQGNTQTVTIENVNINDKSDIDALMRQLGFKLGTI